MKRQFIKRSLTEEELLAASVAISIFTVIIAVLTILATLILIH